MYTHAHMQRGEDKGEGASVFTGQPKSTNRGVSLERMIREAGGELQDDTAFRGTPRRAFHP